MVRWPGAPARQGKAPRAALRLDGPRRARIRSIMRLFRMRLFHMRLFETTGAIAPRAASVARGLDAKTAAGPTR